MGRLGRVEEFELSELRKEVSRLREQLLYIEERHKDAIGKIGKQVDTLEGRLKGEIAEAKPKLVEKKEPVRIIQPPSLPKVQEQAKVVEPALMGPVVSVPGEDEKVEKVEKVEKASFELQFGRVWVVRIGIVIFLTGLVFLGSYAYQNFVRETSNAVRLGCLFGLSGLLIEGGRRLTKKAKLKGFGEVIFADGMAFFYYCTFAAHHVERLRIIESPTLGGILLFLAAAGIAVVSWVRDSKATAVLGIVLASYATMLQPLGWMSGVSSILLGLIGLFFMLRPGWILPGWASMLGNYAAFFGLQVLGASGDRVGGNESGNVWFLAPLWLMFALPGVLGKFKESMSERARAWFAGLNNGLFFLLFSYQWVASFGEVGYWMVAAIFGSILLALGVVGRRLGTLAGSVNLSQGIALCTFALIIRLEGQHLALVLAFEALALAVAGWKFRGKMEVLFALLCGIGSTAILVMGDINPDGRSAVLPVWSASLCAALLGVSSIVVAHSEYSRRYYLTVCRPVALLLFTAALFHLGRVCLFHLEATSGMLCSMGISIVMGLSARVLDRKQRQPEILVGSLVLMFIAVYLGAFSGSAVALLFASAIGIAGAYFWHRDLLTRAETKVGRFYSLGQPHIFAWAYSLAVPVLVFFGIQQFTPSGLSLYHWEHIASLVLVILALLFRVSRLAIGGALLSIVSWRAMAFGNEVSVLGSFLSAGLVVVGAVCLCSRWRSRLENEMHRGIAVWVLRTGAFLFYCFAWYRYSPQAWIDWVAATSIVLSVLALFLRRRVLTEAFAFAGTAVFSLLVFMIYSGWSLEEGQETWRGVITIGSLLALVLSHRGGARQMGDASMHKFLVICFMGLACFVAALWSTQMLVWRLGWGPAVMLWAVLGFIYVSLGLWQRLSHVRMAGFILLAISLGKLFVVDVWDFTAFWRVSSFIVLGAVLIGLGLFYNQFSDVMKSLLEDENEMPKAEE